MRINQMFAAIEDEIEDLQPGDWNEYKRLRIINSIYSLNSADLRALEVLYLRVRGGGA